MARRYSNWDKGTNIANIIFSSGAAGSVVAQVPVLAITLALIVAVLSTIQAFQSFAASSGEMAQLLGKWRTLELEYERLWRNMPALTGDEAMKIHYELRATERDLEEKSVKYPMNETLREKCFADACIKHNIPIPPKQEKPKHELPQRRNQ